MIVCVLGGGVMGSGITSLLGQCEEVSSIIWWARSGSTLEKNFRRVKKEIQRHCRKSGFDSDRTSGLLERIQLSTNLDDASNADMYIEAVAEDVAIKSDLLKNVGRIAKSSAVFATNTSSLSITELSMSYPAPDMIVGMHFFNPTSVMDLVEIVHGQHTADETVHIARNLVVNLGKEPVDVAEAPGFIVNRMLIPMLNEAVSVLAEGIASKEDIDKAMKLGANHPIGPLALADLIGTDVCLSIMETLQKETGDPKYRAHPLLRQYVKAGFLGRKVGRGFYVYKR